MTDREQDPDNDRISNEGSVDDRNATDDSEVMSEEEFAQIAKEQYKKMQEREKMQLSKSARFTISYQRELKTSSILMYAGGAITMLLAIILLLRVTSSDLLTDPLYTIISGASLSLLILLIVYYDISKDPQAE